MNELKISQKGQSVNSDVMVVGVDIGKGFHVAVARRRDGSNTSAFKFISDAVGFAEFWSWLDKWYTMDQFRQILVGVESTGHYWETLAHWLQGKGVAIVQVNPLHTHKAKDLFDNTPAKTDRKDARIIADLVSQGKFLSCLMPRGRYADLRYVVLLRKRLVGERTGQLNLIHRVIDVLFPEFSRVFTNLKTKSSHYLLSHFPTPELFLAVSYEALAQRLCRTSHGRLALTKLARLYDLARSSVGLAEGVYGLRLMLAQSLNRYRQLTAEISGLEDSIRRIVNDLAETSYLQSVKGIGLITVAVLLGETGGFGNYGSAQQVIKLAGLNLFEQSSGQRRGQRHITRRGRSVLREGLYLAAVGVVRQGGLLRGFYERLISKGKAKTVALIAVACKLMRILFALVRDRRQYQADYPSRAAVVGVV